MKSPLSSASFATTKDIAPSTASTTSPQFISTNRIPEELVKIECPFVSDQHEGKELVSVRLPLSSETIFQLLFEDEHFMMNVYKEKNYIDFESTTWEKDTAGLDERVRTVTCTAILPSKALGPSTSFVTEVQTLSSASRSNELYVVNAVIANGGIPYADNFRIHSHYCITKETDYDDGLPHSKLSIWSIVKFKKTTFFVIRGLIEKSSYEGLQAVADEISSTLSTEAEKTAGVSTVNRKKRKQADSEGKTNKLKKANEASDERRPKGKTVCAPWPLFVLSLLIAIAFMNGYFYYRLKEIEIKATRSLNMNADKQFLLLKPSLAITREDWLSNHEAVLKKHFRTWENTFNVALKSINGFVEEMSEILNMLPTYEAELVESLSVIPPRDEEDNKQSFSNHEGSEDNKSEEEVILDTPIAAIMDQ